jgi:fatty-acyl-CoA synthase
MRQHRLPHAALAGDGGGVHGFNLAMRRIQRLERANAQQRLAIPDRPETNLRLLQSRQIKRMNAFGWRGGLHGFHMFAEQRDNARVIQITERDFHDGGLFLWFGVAFQAGKGMAMLSHVIGATDQPLLETTIGEAFDARVAADPDGVALISAHQKIEWTWGELTAQVDALATGLLNMGLTKGDRLGIWSPNCAEWAVVQFATAKAGIILVNINPAYRASEAEYAFNKVGIRALIMAARFKTSDYIAMLGAISAPALEYVFTLGDERHDGLSHYADLLAAPDPARLAAVAATLDRNDPINIQFTSGTTGNPKGATLTHRNILNNGLFTGQEMRLVRGDRYCIPVPLYHCSGMVCGNLACLTSGATMVYPNDAFDAGTVLACVAEHRCTGLGGVPTMFIAMLNHPAFGEFDLSSLRTGFMGGSPCPVATMEEVMARMNMHEVCIVYGMTETSPVSLQTAVDDPFAERVGTVGRVHPHLEVKIIDEAGNTVLRGRDGELCTRGYSVMSGYWDDAAKTAEAIDADGWMHTGDLATIDDAGYARITGRIKDLIIRGGENISPREIEEYLLTHPAIQDAQVIGVPDAKFGEEVCVWIILRSGAVLDEAGVRDFCAGQIAHYKVPRYVRFVSDYPMTVTGKVQKFEMRKVEAAHASALLFSDEGRSTAVPLIRL